MTPRSLAMLAVKAWRESRSRFAISAATLAALCVAFIGFQDPLRRLMGATTGPAASYAGYIYIRVYATVGEGCSWCSWSCSRSAVPAANGRMAAWGFTLALPVPHHVHAVLRAATGLVEIAALAAIPAVLVPAGSALIGEHYAVDQAATFAVLWAAVGSVVFATSFVVSVAIANDYAAIAASVLTVRLVPTALGRVPGLRRLPLQIHELMTGHGMAYFDPQRAMVTGVPWAVVAGSLAIAAIGLAVAVRLTGRERFS